MYNQDNGFFLKEVSRSIAACFSRYSTPLLPIQCSPIFSLPPWSSAVKGSKCRSS